MKPMKGKTAISEKLIAGAYDLIRRAAGPVPEQGAANRQADLRSPAIIA
jgi:hypothetical protein